jgi:cell division protease FtsH
MGPVAYGEQEDEVFLGRSVTQHKNVSDETARKIDEVVRSILDRAYQRTRSMLTENLDKLHVMADALLKYETIDARQINDIMEGRRPGPPADWEGEPDAGKSGPPGGDSGAAVIGGAAAQT